MALATRSGAVLLVAVTVVSACVADAPDGVAAPGLEGVPREITLEAPPLPTTTTVTPESTAAGSPGEASTTTDPSAPEPDVSTADPTTTVEVSPPTEAAGDDAAQAGEGDAPTPTIDDPFLRRGDEGPAVVSLQQRLIELEYLAAGSDTGVFDGATADALIDFQAQYGLVVDGIFGPESDRALNAAAASVTDG